MVVGRSGRAHDGVAAVHLHRAQVPSLVVVVAEAGVELGELVVAEIDDELVEPATAIRKYCMRE